MQKGYCLSSNEIRDWIAQGRILGCNGEDQIQPSSFEPRLSEELYILDTEGFGVFRPKVNETVRQALEKLDPLSRKRVDITNGYELKKGYTYLIRLKETVNIHKGELIRSSPKSSLGRLFLKTRMLSDYNLCFDEINGYYHPDKHLELWLLVQPLAFNVVAYPDLLLNQIRFFEGDSLLTPQDLVKQFETYPLLYTLDGEIEKPVDPLAYITDDGLQLHLSLNSRRTGVVAYRARSTPVPIDLRKIGHYAGEEFFEAVHATNDQLMIEQGEYYLVASKEILRIPKNLNVEVKDYSHIGISGPLHFAGFIDNGFFGDLVFEVRSDEQTRMMLDDGVPLSRLRVYRTHEPDKIYGEAGNNYLGQRGVKLSKYFK